MKVKFIVIGLGVCVACSEDEEEIYCVVGHGGRKMVWNKSLIKSQQMADFIMDKCYSYRDWQNMGFEITENIKTETA